VTRLCGITAVVLGLLFWAGYARGWVGLHMAVGSGMVLSLFLLAVVAVRSRARPGLLVLAIGWAFLVPIFGVMQTRLLPGPLYWVIQLLHLAISGAAIGLASALGSHIARTAAGRPGRDRTAELAA
jgi:uncharacterized membrane protein YczE